MMSSKFSKLCSFLVVGAAIAASRPASAADEAPSAPLGAMANRAVGHALASAGERQVSRAAIERQEANAWGSAGQSELAGGTDDPYKAAVAIVEERAKAKLMARAAKHAASGEALIAKGEARERGGPAQPARPMMVRAAEAVEPRLPGRPLKRVLGYALWKHGDNAVRVAGGWAGLAKGWRKSAKASYAEARAAAEPREGARIAARAARTARQGEGYQANADRLRPKGEAIRTAGVTMYARNGGSRPLY